MKQEFIKSELLTSMTADGFCKEDIIATDHRHGPLVSTINIVYASDISPYSKFYIIMKYGELSASDAIELCKLFVNAYHEYTQTEDKFSTTSDYDIMYNPFLSRCLINWYTNNFR